MRAREGLAAASDALSPAWRRSLVAFLLLLATIMLIHWDAVVSMVTVWANSRTYNHGFLIPPIVAYLLWQRRKVLREEAPRASVLGLLWLLLAASGALLGELAQANTIAHFALVFMIQGAVVAVFGPRIAWRLAFPLFYLLFMVPFGDFAIEPMQDLTARATTVLVRASGVPIYLENWVMVIPGGAFLVAEACSGVRFLIATIALGVLMTNLFFSRFRKRLLFLLLSVLVPIVANVARTYGIVMLAYLSDFTLAVGVDHIVYGFIFLSLVLFVLIGIAYAMRDPEEADVAPVPPAAASRLSESGDMRRLVLVTLAAIATLGAVEAYAARLEAPTESVAVALGTPRAGNGWKLLERDGPGWRGDFPGADAEATWRFAKGDRLLHVFVAYYGSEYPGKELITHRNSLLGSDTSQALRAGRLREWEFAGVPPPAFLVLRGVDGPTVVWYWYGVDGHITADRNEAKFVAMKEKLLGRRAPSALIAIAGDGSPRDTAALIDFLKGSDLGTVLVEGALESLLSRGAAE